MKTLNIAELRTELLSGLTVAFALVPEAIAFAFVAHLDPLIALYTAFFIGLITSLFGGRPGMISGATGALAVVLTSLVITYGVEYLFATVILMGLIQVLAGFLKLGKFIRIVPYPVMLGFVNGLAIVIFLSQLNQFKFTDSLGNLTWMQGEALYIMLALVCFTMFIIHYLPKLTKSIPSSLVAILVIFTITQLLNLDTKDVGDMATVSGSLPKFHIPDIAFNLATLKIIFPYAIILAAIGLIESLLALTLVDEITETRGKKSQECKAQGWANIITGFFGGMGGCAMIGQTMININSGARKRISGVFSALCLLSFILFASKIIEAIPLAALIGVMFMVVIKTFSWSSLRIINKIPKTDALVIFTVSISTVFFDLAIAVLIGVIISALVYVWKSSQHISADISEQDHIKTYKLYGPLFFGSITSFNNLFTHKKDPQNIIVDFSQSRIWDHSALEALQKLHLKYQSLNKIVKYRGLSADCSRLLKNSGRVIESSKETDPHYEIVMDYHK